MQKDLFEALVQTVHEGGAILRGEAESSRSFTFETPDVKASRDNKNESNETP